MLGQQVFDNPSIARNLQKDYILFHADVRSEEGNAIFQRYDVNATPTVAVVNSRGFEVDRIVGYMDYDWRPHDFVAELAALVESPENYSALRNQWEKDGNLEDVAELLVRCVEQYRVDDIETWVGILDQNESVALEIPVVYGSDSLKANAWEFVLGVKSSFNPGVLYTFMGEYPQSELKGFILQRAARNLRNDSLSVRTREVFEDLLTSYPSDPDLLIPLINHFGAREGVENEVIAWAENLFQHHPEKMNASIRSRMAIALLSIGNADRAMEVYGESYGDELMRDGNASSLNSYAWFWSTRSLNLEKSLQASLSSININGENPYYWDTLSMVYWKMERYEEAIEAEEQGLKFATINHDAYHERIEQIRADMQMKQTQPEDS